MLSIHLSDPSRLDVFCAFLTSVHVQVDDVRGDGVVASLPGAPSEARERTELSAYLTTWNALNPGCSAVLVG